MNEAVSKGGLIINNIKFRYIKTRLSIFYVLYFNLFVN